MYCQRIIIIADDLNIDLLTSNSISGAYTDFLPDYHLVQHASEPTRITDSSATLIDHHYNNLYCGSLYVSISRS